MFLITVHTRAIAGGSADTRDREVPASFHPAGAWKIARELPPAAAGELQWSVPHGVDGWEDVFDARNLREHPHGPHVVALAERLLSRFGGYPAKLLARGLAAFVRELDADTNQAFAFVRDGDAFFVVLGNSPYDELVARWTPDHGVWFERSRYLPL